MKDIIYIILALNCLMVGYHYEHIKKDSYLITTIFITIVMLIVAFPCYVFLYLYKGIRLLLSFFGIINFLNLVPLYLRMYDHLLNKEAVKIMQDMANDISKKQKTTISEKSFFFTHKRVISYINRKNLA